MASLWISFGAGVVTWTLLEYLLHRFLGHDRRTMPNFFSIEHTRHHSVGDYFAPLPKKAVATVLVAVLAYGIASRVAAAASAAAFVTGLTGMYVGYELIHRRAHTHPERGLYSQWQRRHHFHHHFVSPRHNHGVTSPVWDFVFGTYVSPGEIAVPRRLAMRWLCDPATDDVRAEFADTYRLVGDTTRERRRT